MARIQVKCTERTRSLDKNVCSYVHTYVHILHIDLVERCLVLLVVDSR